jgi:hypothetical protein
MLVVSSVLSDQLGLVGWNIAGKGSATFSTLEIVVRPIGSLTDYAKFAGFHVLDLGDLLEQLGSSRLFHTYRIYTYVYILPQKNRPLPSYARITSYALLRYSRVPVPASNPEWFISEDTKTESNLATFAHPAISFNR